MAKNKKERVILEDIELKPQVIGYTYQKKSNIGRVIFIFAIFALVVFYINDISVFINNLLGRNSASSIVDLTENNNKENNNKNNVENEVVYNIYSNTLSITEGNITLNNFNFNNNLLTFDVLNNTNTNISLKDKKYFIETYTENKTLLERSKLDIGDITSNGKISYSFDLNNNFYYLVLEEKTINDYPNVELNEDSNGLSTITCNKNIESIIYTFRNDELYEIKHTISESDTTNEKYYTNYSAYQNKVTSYNNVEGITATFNGNLNGYTAVFAIDLQKANLSTISEKYYYGFKEIPKVVKFEMQTYGFSCN